MISTRDLARLPGIDELRSLTQSLAMLDAILSPEWESRTYSFNARWSRGKAMASMRNGEGDEYFLLFSKAGAILKGFAHEAVMSPYASDPPRVHPGVLDAVPAVFSSFLGEPAFMLEDTTFCIWRTRQDLAWQRGPIELPRGRDPDGSAELLAILDGNTRTYRIYAESYFERRIDPRAARHIYAHEPLTQKVVSMLNEELSLEDLGVDIREIAYPSPPGKIRRTAPSRC
jgi:hypothetical protein